MPVGMTGATAPREEEAPKLLPQEVRKGNSQEEQNEQRGTPRSLQDGFVVSVTSESLQD